MEEWYVDISLLLFGVEAQSLSHSGAPIDVSPLMDDPALAADPKRNNNFDFSDVRILENIA